MFGCYIGLRASWEDITSLKGDWNPGPCLSPSVPPGIMKRIVLLGHVLPQAHAKVPNDYFRGLKTCAK